MVAVNNNINSVPAHMHTHTHIHLCIRGGVGDSLDILQCVGQGELANSYKVINNRLIQA